MRIVIATAAALALATTAAHADSLVYEQPGQGIWISTPDGARKHHVTATEALTEPSASDDGTLMLVDRDGGLLHRTDTFGRPLGAPLEAVPQGPLGDLSLSGTQLANISPDGRRVAYGYAWWDGGGTRHASVWWGPADRQTPPPVPGDGIPYTDPAWVTNDRMIVTHEDQAGPGETQAALLDADDGRLHPWFDDPQSTYKDDATPFVVNLGNGAISADRRHVAFGATTILGGVADNDNELRIFKLSAEPPATPALQCVIRSPQGSFSSPAWSPDGTRLAWAEDDGVHVATIGTRSDCEQPAEPVVLPGAQAPFWTRTGLPGDDDGQDPPPPPPAGDEPPPPSPPAADLPPVRPTSAARPVAACVVPRVKGRRLRIAKRLARARGCRVKVKGRGGRRALVRVQRPAAGTRLARDARITLVVRPARR